MIGRRQFFGLTAAGVAAMLPGTEAAACSLVATNRTPFNERANRRAIAHFVRLLNVAPGLPEEEVVRQSDDLAFSIEDEWVDETLGERSASDVERQSTFLREYRFAGGRLDPKPIELESTNLIRRLGNRATYQFTLKRYSYHPADPEGCNGMFVHDAHYGYDRISCLAALSANRLRHVRRFHEWYLED
jgi:hypothetical protein